MGELVVVVALALGGSEALEAFEAAEHSVVITAVMLRVR